MTAARGKTPVVDVDIDALLRQLEDAMNACCDQPIGCDFMTLTRSWRGILESVIRPAEPTGGLDEALKALNQLTKLSHDDDCALMAEGSHPEARCNCCLRFALGELRYFLLRRTVHAESTSKAVVATVYPDQLGLTSTQRLVDHLAGKPVYLGAEVQVYPVTPGGPSLSYRPFDEGLMRHDIHVLLWLREEFAQNLNAASPPQDALRRAEVEAAAGCTCVKDALGMHAGHCPAEIAFMREVRAKSDAIREALAKVRKIPEIAALDEQLLEYVVQEAVGAGCRAALALLGPTGVPTHGAGETK